MHEKEQRNFKEGEQGKGGGGREKSESAHNILFYRLFLEACLPFKTLSPLGENQCWLRFLSPGSYCNAL